MEIIWKELFYKMKNAKIMLRNTFHNTQCTVVLPEIYKDEPSANPWHFIEMNASHDKSQRRRMQRVKRLLCGVSDCKCGVVR